MATVVVIDDNRQVRDVVVRALSGAGYAVMDWADPSAAIAYLASNRETIALVVIDGVMPQLTGPEAAARIRLARPAVPILLMSGHEAPMFKEFFGKPGHHYIAKPFVIQDLVARIAGIIGPAPSRPV
jgi:two-component system, cell cycle sensor histidine kinase and response regulator CckA